MRDDTLKRSIRNMNLVEVQSEQKSKWQLLLQLNKTFLRANKAQESATAAGYELAQLHAQRLRAVTDGALITQCLTKIAGIMCPQKLNDFNKVSKHV